MKRPFRFFRSELNGFYLRALTAAVNIAVNDILDEYVYQTNHKWKLEKDLNGEELGIRESDIYNIAKLTGLNQLNVFRETKAGSISFSRSHVVNNAERSERGFVNMLDESMIYQRTVSDAYADDIIKLATKDLRAGLVPSGTPPVGYVLENLPIYDIQGNIIKENILSEPPSDGTPYSAFYGEKFLTLERNSVQDAFVGIETFKTLFECLQRVQHDGQSIKDFLEMTRIIGDGYIHQIEIMSRGRFYLVNYELNKQCDTDNKLIRYATWLHVCRQKFKLFVVFESEEMGLANYLPIATNSGEVLLASNVEAIVIN